MAQGIYKVHIEWSADVNDLTSLAHRNKAAILSLDDRLRLLVNKLEITRGLFFGSLLNVFL